MPEIQTSQEKMHVQYKDKESPCPKNIPRDFPAQGSAFNSLLWEWVLSINNVFDA